MLMTPELYACYAVSTVALVQAYFTLRQEGLLKLDVSVVVLAISAVVFGLVDQETASSIGLNNNAIEIRTAVLIWLPLVLSVLILPFLPQQFLDAHSLRPSIRSLFQRDRLAQLALYCAWGFLQQLLYLPFFQLALANAGVPAPVAALLSITAFVCVHYPNKSLMVLTLPLGVWLHGAYCVSAFYWDSNWGPTGPVSFPAIGFCHGFAASYVQFDPTLSFNSKQERSNFPNRRQPEGREAAADPMARGNQQLRRAVEKGQASVVRAPRASGADANYTGADGASMVEVASRNNDHKVVAVLIAAGAKLHR